MKYHKFYISVLAITIAATAAAQTPVIDSMKHSIRLSNDDEKKLLLIFEISEQSISSDSLLPFVLMAEKIALTSRNKQDADIAAYCRASYYTRKNATDSALMIIEKLVAEYKNNREQQTLYLKFLFSKAKLLDRSNQYTKALAQLVEVLEVAEKLKDTLVQIQSKTGIGWVQMEMGQYKEALEWLHKSMNTSTDPKFYKNYGALYSNMASAYNSLGNSDSAIYYINVAIKDARENENLSFLATALSMQAQIFIDSKKSWLAEEPLHEVVAVRKQLNDPFYIVYDMSTLASYYASNNQPQKGIALCKEGIVIAKQKGMTSQLLMIYQALAENYKRAGNAEEYGNTLEYIMALKDSFSNINSSKLIAEIQAGSEAQEKEKQILEQKLVLTRKNYWLYGSALFAVMLGITGWVGFRNYRRKQRLKMEMALEEEKRLSEKAIIDAEEFERKRIAADLHDNLGAYAASLASNLGYIHLPDADENTKNAFRELGNNSNAIISQLNDTIWVLKKDTLSLTAISDRLKNFINRIQKSYPDVNVEVKEEVTADHLLPSSQAFHLYRILQEAVNNALKHSKGRNIIVQMSSGQSWKIIVQDDGVGIAGEEMQTSSGNGLLNMKERCREAGWEISWEKTTGGGTTLNVWPTTN